MMTYFHTFMRLRRINHRFDDGFRHALLCRHHFFPLSKRSQFDNFQTKNNSGPILNTVRVRVYVKLSISCWIEAQGGV